MRVVPALGAIAIVLAPWAIARAELGWTEAQYNQAYGQGQRGFAKANERAYTIGQSHLVVEFPVDGTTSIGELWALGTSREGVPQSVLAEGAAAEKGTPVEQVYFKAKGSLVAEIREATVDGVVVRADVRNNLLTRVARCGKPPTCSLWRRIFGPACETTVPCPVLERALASDKTLDEFHVRMERAAERGSH